MSFLGRIALSSLARGSRVVPAFTCQAFRAQNLSAAFTPKFFATLKESTTANTAWVCIPLYRNRSHIFFH